MTELTQEAFWETDRAKLLRLLPWLHLLRGFRLATRWQNLALALFAVLALAGGRWALSHLPYSSHNRGVKSTAYHAIGAWDADVNVDRRTQWPWQREYFREPLPDSRALLTESWLPAPGTLLAPLGDFVRPASILFQRRNNWSDVADAWMHVLLVLTVGSVLGGAITRRVALEFGRSTEIGLRDALKFSFQDFRFVFGAPLISVVGIGLLLLVGRAVGWIGRIPGIGETLAAVGWGLVLLVSLVMALIVLGVAIAWPLMVAAHSCEGTDGFDALNRAYNYVFVRPWYALWLLFLMLLYGLAILTFTLLLVGLTVHLSEWIAAGPLPDESLARITQAAPPQVDVTRFPRTTPTLATRIGGVWQRGLASLLTAFVYSYFWTAATIIYLLLRKSTDATELNTIYWPMCRPKTDGPPLVGIPAAEQREAAAANSEPAPPAPASPPPESPA